MTADLDLTTYTALSFDCYGTLIDWEAGIAAVLRPWAVEHDLDVSDEELLLTYADNEAAVEREAASALYPDVLAAAFRRTGEKLGRPVSDTWAQRLGESVPEWPPFPDSADSLARLVRHYKLIILSNVHRAGFAASNERLRGDFAAVITAEDVGAYKPAENHFRAIDAALEGLGLDRCGLCTSRRACSTITSQRSGKVCRRSGSTAATTAPVGERPPNPQKSGPTTCSSTRWPPSQAPSTKRSPNPDPPCYGPRRIPTQQLENGRAGGPGPTMPDLCQPGAPAWVRQRDGSRRPAEYLGDATTEYLSDQGKVVVIFVDAPGRATVDTERVSPRPA